MGSGIIALCKTRRLTIEVLWDVPLCRWIVGEGITIIWNVGNYSPYRTAQDRKIFKSSASRCENLKYGSIKYVESSSDRVNTVSKRKYVIIIRSFEHRVQTEEYDHNLRSFEHLVQTEEYNYKLTF